MTDCVGEKDTIVSQKEEVDRDGVVSAFNLSHMGWIPGQFVCPIFRPSPSLCIDLGLVIDTEFTLLCHARSYSVFLVFVFVFFG
jgi:hypothetical protein